MNHPILLILICFAAWGCLHSWLASLEVKACARRIFSKVIDGFYRLIFIGIAVLTLLPILAMVIFLPSHLVWRIPTPWIYGTVAIQVLCILGLLVTIFRTDVWAFIGFRQIRHPEVENEKPLVITGMYKVVRHPLYLLTMILMWLFPYMTDLVLAFIIAGTAYFLIGSIPEEAKMLKHYGETYRQYKDEVPRIIPRIKLKR